MPVVIAEIKNMHGFIYIVSIMVIVLYLSSAAQDKRKDDVCATGKQTYIIYGNEYPCKK